jgi:ubiquinone/menaquinone biosynthesis C-methylase UbiE
MLEAHWPREGLLVDVGGGTGVGAATAVAAAPRGTFRHTVVVDAQRGMLARAARAPRPEIDLVRGDAVRLPLRDGSVDLVLSLGVLCCLTSEAVPMAVEESWRVLRPGGLAVVAVPRWRGDQDMPRFRARGFRPLEHPRAGWVLYHRPAGPPPGPPGSPDRT